jgi:hypothetical protein
MNTARRRTLIAACVAVGVIAGGVVTVVSEQKERAHAEVIATQPAQRGWGLYLGTVPGLTVGIATNGRTVQAFARNADASEVTWFDGLLAGNSFDITAANGTTLAAGVVGGNAHGRYVTKTGVIVAFDVPAPIAQGALYRGGALTSDGRRIDAGWVVSETGSVTGGVLVSSSKGSNTAATRSTTATALETAGTADTGQGIVPLRRVKPDTLDLPVPTALTGAALGNQPGRNVKDEVSTKVNVDTVTDAPALNGTAILAQLSGPALVEIGKPFELRLSLGNPDQVVVDGAAIEVGLPAAFAMGDRPDEAIPKGCAESKVQEATTVADDEVPPNGSQLLGRNISLAKGGTCDLTIDVTAKAAGVFEIVTSPPRAPGRPAGASGRLTVTVLASKPSGATATFADPALVPNGICAAPASSPDGPKSIVANVSLGASPLPVRLTTTGFGAAESWTLKLSDGTPSITCTGAPPALIPHTFVNLADPSTADPVVFTAEMTAVVKGKPIEALRVSIEVYPRLKDGKSRRIASLVTPTNGVFLRGTNSTATVEVLNAADQDLVATKTVVTVAIVTETGTTVAGTLAPTAGPWTCSAPQSCHYDGVIGKLGSPPPLQLTVAVPAPGPQSYKVTATVTGVTTTNVAVNVDRAAIVPVEGVIARASAGGRLRPLEPSVVTAPPSFTAPGGGVALNAAGGLLPPEPPPPPAQFPSLSLDKTGKLAPTRVTLDGRSSIHGQRPTAYHWEQVRAASDPAVTFDGGGNAITETFNAPIVLAPTVLTFRLVVSDTISTDDDTVPVTITPVDRAPIVKVDAVTTAPTGEVVPVAGKAFKIAFSAKDPDGEAMTLAWTIDTPVPAGAVVTNSTTLTIPTWPIPGVPQIVAVARATDTRNVVTAKTVLIGVKPTPPSLTVTATPATVKPGGSVKLQVADATGSTTAFVWELADGSAPASLDASNGASLRVAVDTSALPGTAVKVRVHPQNQADPVATIAIPVLPAPVALPAPPTPTVPGDDCIAVGASFPVIPLPGDYTVASASIKHCGGVITLTGDATGPGGATLHVQGTQLPDGFLGDVTIHNLALLGGVVDTGNTAGHLDTRNGGVLRVAIANADVHVPGVGLLPPSGVHVAAAEAIFSVGGIAVHAEARLGTGNPDFDVNIDGILASTGAFALSVTAKTTGQLVLHPKLPPINAADFAGSLAFSGTTFAFRFSAAVSTSWAVVPNVITITGLRVEFGNVDPPASCPSADGLFLAVAGTGTVNTSLTPDPIALAIDGCVGLPGTSGSGSGNTQPFFQIDSTVVLGSWRPIAGFDLVVKNVGITVKYAGTDLSLDVHGRADILGLDDVAVKAQVVNGTFVVAASANLGSIGIPIDHAVVAIASPPGVTNFDIDLDGDLSTGRQITLPAGITAIAEMPVPGADQLNKVLNPQNKPTNDPQHPIPHIDPTVIFLANISDAGVTLKASVGLGAEGFTILKMCSAGVFDQCNSMLDATTEVKLTSFELGVAVGTGGVEVSATAFGTMLLPKQNVPNPPTSGVVARDVVPIGASVFVAPPVVGFSIFLNGNWPNPFGITGFSIDKFAFQLAIDFSSPPGAPPIVSIGILLETHGLPSFFQHLLNPNDPAPGSETVRLAVNISKLAPIFELTLGDHDGHPFMHPHASLAIDDASLVIAPLGGKIGPFVYPIGTRLSFGGKLFSLVVDGTFNVTIAPPMISGHLDVGRLAFGPLTIEQTKVDVVVDPAHLAFCMHAQGGVEVIRGGPKFTADATFITGPGQCQGFAAPPPTGIKASGTLIAENWTIAPGIKLNINVEAKFDGLDNPSVEMTATASATVMGGQQTFIGTLRFENGVVQRFSLSTSVPQITVGLVAISCGSVPCLTLVYDALGQPRVQGQVHGTIKIDSLGIAVAIDGLLDTTHVALNAVLQAGTSKINGIALNGELFFASGDPDARIIDASGQSVAAQQGDFRLSAKTVDPVQLGSATARWVFAVGRANGGYYFNGSADLQVFGVTAHVSGDFKMSPNGLGFHVEGKSGGQVDTAKTPTLNAVQRGAVRVAFSSAGHYDEDVLTVDAKLVFRADYKFKVILDNGTGLTVSADGSTSLRYVEYPNGDAEKRSRQTQLGDGKLRFDSKTGRFCYSVTIDGDTYQAGSC